MAYILDNTALNLTYSARLFYTDYTSSEEKALSIFWPALAESGKYDNFSVAAPVLPVLPAGWEAFSAGTSDLNTLIYTTDPKFKDSQIFWGDPATTGLVIDWSPNGTFNKITELKTAIENGIENGTFDQITAYLDGVTLLTATFTNNLITLTVGEARIQIEGAWLRGFQDLIEFSTALNEFGFLLGEALAGNISKYDAEVAAVTAVLNQYSLDALRLLSADETIFSISESATQQTLQIGSVEITAKGSWTTDLIDFLALAETAYNLQILGDALATGNLDLYADVRAEVLSVLSAYSLDSLAITLEGDTVLEYSVTSSQIQLNLLGATLTLTGTFPTDNVGQMLDLLLDVAVQSDTSPITSFDQVDGLDIDQLEVRNDQGDLLVGAYIPNEFGSLDKAATALIEGSEASENIAADWVPRASNRVFDLLGGDDKITLYQSSELWGVEGITDFFMYGSSSNGHGVLYFQNPQIATADPIEILGGAGQDELEIRIDADPGSYAYVTRFLVDLAAGTLIGENTEKGSDIRVFDLSFDSIETLSLQSGQQIDVKGSANSDHFRLLASAVSAWDSNWVNDYLPTILTFNGAGGDDTFTFRKDEATSPVVDVQEFFNQHFTVTTLGTNDYLFSSELYTSDIRLTDVERVVFETPLAKQTVLVTDLAGVTPYNGGISIIGTPKDGQRLTVDTSDIRDPDGVGAHTVDWYRDNILISSDTYLDLTADDIGSKIMLEVTYQDNAGNKEVLSDFLGDTISAYDRGLSDTYINKTLHAADGSERLLEHGEIEIVTTDRAIQIDNYYWGTDLPKTLLATDEEFSMSVSTDLHNAVSISDVISQLRHIVGLSKLTGMSATAADFNGDGSIAISDVIQSLRTIVGLDVPERARIIDAEGQDTFTLDSLNSTLYVVAPGDVDLSWAPVDLL